MTVGDQLNLVVLRSVAQNGGIPAIRMALPRWTGADVMRLVTRCERLGHITKTRMGRYELTVSGDAELHRGRP